MRLTRFERKILFAIGAVAIVPLVGALLLGHGALREAYQVGVNPRVHRQLEQALDVYREHFVALRHDAERTADAVAHDWRLRKAIETGGDGAVEGHLERLISEYHNVARVRIRDAGGTILGSAERAERLDRSTMRLLTQRRDVGAEHEGLQAEVTIATPAAPFHEYQRAGEVEEVYSQLRASAEYVSNFYLVVYIAFLLSVIVVAMGVGFVLSRRVTRRVVDLVEATERVGAGDLSVQLSTDVRDEVGELTAAFNVMVRDLRESRERIEYLQRIGAWQEFARRLAHEIKNPLTPIQLAAQEMLQSYKGEDEKYRRNLADACAIIEEEVATLRRLVSEFSAFAKLPQAQLSAADLAELVQEIERSVPGMLEDLGLDPEQPEIQVECRTEREPIPVRIDSMMLKRCVSNLLRNGMQAVRGLHEHGGGRVVLEARRDGEVAVLEVRDDGPGVANKDRTRIFDPYYTTKSEGTGLGLAIVKKVVLEHGGEIDCDEAPEGGATFRIRLPIDRPQGALRAGRSSWIEPPKILGRGR